MKRIIFLLIVWLAFIFSAPAAAQEPIKFSELEVDLWPEYDRPTMLVIYRITLHPSVSLPAAISLRIPGEVSGPNAVAAQQPDGSLINVPYEVGSSGDWNILQFQATMPDLQIEYYDPSLSMNGISRSFEFRWTGDYSVDRFLMQVQQPRGAANMLISPSLGTGSAAQDGFTYFISEMGAFSEGQMFSIKVSYDKETDELSASQLPISPSGPLEENPMSRITISDALPWLLGIIGLVLLVGGGLWYWQSGRDQEKMPSEHRRSRKKPPAYQAEAHPEGAFVYCHQCGKRANPGDRFCRSCGTQLRIG